MSDSIMHSKAMTLRISRTIACLCLLCYYSNSSMASDINQSPPWQLVKDEQGIQVYTQKVDESPILKVKTRVTINSHISHIRAILDNAAQRKNWIPYLENSIIHQSFSATEKLEYSHFSAPWPASDRDFVYRIQLTHQDDKRLIYHMKSEISSLLPENDNIIRGELIESTYILTSLDEHKTKVELIYHADPKGWLPVWIINIIQKTLPYLILRNLREQAAGGYQQTVKQQN